MPKKIIKRLKLIGLIAVPLVLLFLPSDYFDEGESICLSVLLFDTTCYGCGLTRAVMHFIHFEFQEAYSYHPISFITTPILIIYWGREMYKTIMLFY